MTSRCLAQQPESIDPIQRITRKSRTWHINAVILALGLLLVPHLSACSSEQAKRRASESAHRIAVVPRAPDDPLWPILRARIARENARPEDTGVAFEPQIPVSSDPSAQSALLSSLRSGVYRGVVAYPADMMACRSALEGLARNGVVVVTLGVAPESETLAYSCTEDPGEIGSRVADATAEWATNEETVGVVYAGTDSPHALRRFQAFEHRLRGCAWVHIVTRVDVGGEPAQARQRFAEALERFPRTRLWVSLSGWPIQLADRTPLSGVPDHTRLIVTDPSPLQWADIRNGRIVASVGVNYQQMAERAVGMCAALCRGETVQVRRHVLDAETATASNLKEWIDRWSD